MLLIPPAPPLAHAAGARASAANAIVHLFATDGQHLTAFCDNDGSFTLRDVPKGSHLMQAHLMQFYYPEVGVLGRRGCCRAGGRAPCMGEGPCVGEGSHLMQAHLMQFDYPEVGGGWEEEEAFGIHGGSCQGGGHHAERRAPP
jgi:hypothetical protein